MMFESELLTWRLRMNIYSHNGAEWIETDSNLISVFQVCGHVIEHVREV